MSSDSRHAFAWAALAAAGFVAAPAHAQEQLWITQFGTSAYETAYALAPDGSGGVYVGGYTTGNLGGPLSGVADVFLARYDDAGDQTWIAQIGSREYDVAFGLAGDGSNGVYFCGSTRGYWGGPWAGPRDAIVGRFDSAGNHVWHRQLGTSGSDDAFAVVSDGVGGVYVAGATDGSLGGLRIGLSDAYLARYDAVGNQIWIRQFGEGEWDNGKALASDGKGGVFVGGSTYGSPGGGSGSGTWDGYLAHYDGASNQTWIRRFGSVNAHDYVYSLAPDGSGGVYVGGHTTGDFAGPSAGGDDALLARYDSEGNQTWIRQFGTSEDDWGLVVASDGSGGVFFGGGTRGDLGSSNAGASDAYLGHHDGAGNQTWIHQFGTSEIDGANAVASDGLGGVYVSGPTKGDLGGPNSGLTDVFLARYVEASCYADCDRSGTLDIFDFLCFQNSFVAGEPYACECEPDPACDIFDFLCFQTAFVAGCP